MLKISSRSCRNVIYDANLVRNLWKVEEFHFNCKQFQMCAHMYMYVCNYVDQTMRNHVCKHIHIRDYFLLPQNKMSYQHARYENYTI